MIVATASGPNKLHVPCNAVDTEFARSDRAFTASLRSVIEIQRLHYGTNKEIVDAAGISVAALKSRLLRARAQLRSSLQSSMSSTLTGFASGAKAASKMRPSSDDQPDWQTVVFRARRPALNGS